MTVLAQKARLSVAWTTGINVFRDVVQFGLMLVLVRLIPAEAYGQFGLVNTIIGFTMVFSSREFIAHTLLVRDDRDVNYQEQFLAGCVIQGTLFVLANLAALGLRSFPTYAPVAPLLHVTSFLLLLDLPSELRTRMLERALDWQRLRTIEAIGVLAGAVMSLTLGLAGAGVYALVLPSFVIPVAFLVDLFFVARWRPTLSWHSGRYRESRDFGLRRVLSVSFVSASNLLESGVLARVVGYSMLGIFGRALSMAMLFCQRVAGLLMSSLYPILARIPRQSEAYKRVSVLVLRIIAWTVVPCATVVSLLGEGIVRTLYGTRWLSVIPLVPWAMTVGAFLAMMEAAYKLLLAHQEPRRCLQADIWRLVGMSAALAVALPFGLAAYLGALIVVHGLALTMALWWLHQEGAMHGDAVITAIGPAAVAAALAAAAAEGGRHWAYGQLPLVAQLVLYGALFGATYLLCLRALFASLLRELVVYLPEAAKVHRLLGFAEAA